MPGMDEQARELLRALDASPALLRACNVLEDAEMLTEASLEACLLGEQKGWDPVEFAERLVEVVQWADTSC